MSSTAARGEKAFVAEQKLRELKKRIFRFKAMKKMVVEKTKPIRNNKKVC